MKSTLPTLISVKRRSGTIISYIELNVALFLLFILTACGQQSGSQLVSDVKVATNLVNEQVWVDVKAKFDLGNTMLPSVTLPVVNPKNPSQQYGTISMAPTFDGKNEIGIAVNFTEALKIQGGPASLPNGTSLPVGGLNGVDVIQLNIPNTLARVYIALDQGVAMAGFAIAIKELDQIGSTIGNINLFPSFKIEKIIGIAGVFTGTASGQTGLALFVDLSSVLNQKMLDHTNTNLMANEIKGQMKMNTVNPSSSKKSKLQNSLFNFATGSKKKLSLK